MLSGSPDLFQRKQFLLHPFDSIQKCRNKSLRQLFFFPACNPQHSLKPDPSCKHNILPCLCYHLLRNLFFRRSNCIDMHNRLADGGTYFCLGTEDLKILPLCRLLHPFYHRLQSGFVCIRRKLDLHIHTDWICTSGSDIIYRSRHRKYADTFRTSIHRSPGKNHRSRLFYTDPRTHFLRSRFKHRLISDSM